MKPIVLRVQAFGPFSGRQEIAFDALHNVGLFLINGATGAGKSTLLDALCFALYGQTTGNERAATEMRCAYAQSTDITEVEFEFALSETLFRVRRTPQQSRPKARGEGVRQIGAEAQLWQWKEGDWLLLAGAVTEVNEQIGQLLGLNAAQFRQVMVLPQGKFREFLLADSRARETILSALFGTHIFQKIELRLKEKASLIKQGVQDFISLEQNMLASTGVESRDELNSREVELKKFSEESEKVKKITFLKLQRAQEEWQTMRYRAERHQLKQQKEQALALLIAKEEEVFGQKKQLELHEKASAIFPYCQRLKKQKTQCDELNAVLKDEKKNWLESEKEIQYWQKKNRAAQEEAGALDRLKLEQHQLREYRVAWQDVTELQAQLESSAQAQSATHARMNQSEQAIQESTLRLQDLDVQVKQAEQDGLAMAEKQLRVEQLTEQRDMLRKLELKKVDFSRIQQAVDDNEKKLAKQLQCQRNAEEKLQTSQLLWHRQQAAILATQLNKGEPCPVCGSCEHPAPQSRREVLISESTIDTLRSELDLEQKKYMELWQVTENTKGDSKVLKNAITEMQGQLDRALAGGTIYAIENHLNTAQSALERLRELKNTIPKWRAQMTEEQVRKDDAIRSFEQFRERLSKEKEVYVTQQVLLEQNLLSIPKDLQDMDALELKITQVDNRILEIQTILAETDEKVEYFTQQYRIAEMSVKTLEGQLAGHNQALREARDDLVARLQSSVFADESELMQAIMDDADLVRHQKAISDYEKARRTLESTLAELEIELKDKPLVKVDEVEQTYLSLQKEYDQAEAQWLSASQEYQSAKDVLNRIEVLHQQQTARLKEYETVGTLADVASGQNEAKISFQRFILSVLLDDVLQQANLRLHQMTQGRYRLQRKIDRSKGNKASGLEVEIMDEYSGRSRSAATLSGGESFLAALALALGLSDVVQAYSGGVRLDTLFIDEGFGSLDAEALDQALQVLLELRETGRLIGVISHVAELKEQIPARIDVIASRMGSRVHVSAFAVA